MTCSGSARSWSVTGVSDLAGRLVAPAFGVLTVALTVVGVLFLRTPVEDGTRATAATARFAAVSSTAQASRDGWAKRAQTDTVGASARLSAKKSASLSTAYLAASPSFAKGKTLGGMSLFWSCLR